MKKLTTLLLTLALVLSLAACGDTTVVTVTPSSEPEAVESDTPAASGGNTLVVYFSVMETDGVGTVGGASRVSVDGEPLET